MCHKKYQTKNVWPIFSHMAISRFYGLCSISHLTTTSFLFMLSLPFSLTPNFNQVVDVTCNYTRMMASLQANHSITIISKSQFYGETKFIHHPITPLYQQKSFSYDKFKVTSLSESNSNSSSSGNALVQPRPVNTEDLEIMIDQTTVEKSEAHETGIECLVKENGWRVRRMEESKSEMKMVADIQARAFHVPGPFFDDFFFHFFQAEVLAALLYRLRNSPPDRYACLVAEPSTEDDTSSVLSQKQHLLVGVVDMTVLRDTDVLKHLEEAQEYVYVSGIAVSNNYRRRKVATILLQACEVLSYLWGQEFLVLRAYEDDSGARALYTNAGYRLVSRDPIWVTWIGRKRRILMVKCIR